MARTCNLNVRSYNMLLDLQTRVSREFEQFFVQDSLLADVLSGVEIGAGRTVSKCSTLVRDQSQGICSTGSGLILDIERDCVVRSELFAGRKDVTGLLSSVSE
jgi:hypothetical protein